MDPGIVIDPCRVFVAPKRLVSSSMPSDGYSGMEAAIVADLFHIAGDRLWHDCLGVCTSPLTTNELSLSLGGEYVSHFNRLRSFQLKPSHYLKETVNQLKVLSDLDCTGVL